MALMAEHDDARQARPMTTIEQAVCTGNSAVVARLVGPIHTDPVLASYQY